MNKQGKCTPNRNSPILITKNNPEWSLRHKIVRGFGILFCICCTCTCEKRWDLQDNGTRLGVNSNHTEVYSDFKSLFTARLLKESKSRPGRNEDGSWFQNRAACANKETLRATLSACAYIIDNLSFILEDRKKSDFYVRIFSSCSFHQPVETIDIPIERIGKFYDFCLNTFLAIFSDHHGK